MPADYQENFISLNPTLSAWAEQDGNIYTARALKYWKASNSFLSVKIILQYNELHIHGEFLQVDERTDKRQTFTVQHREKTCRAFIMQDARELVELAASAACSIIRESDDKRHIAANMLYYLQQRTPQLVKLHLGIKG